MEKIKLQQVLPAVFAENRSSLDSDIWLQDISFEKGKYYLIEAASGTGKSSLCSYLYGDRNDYSGSIFFDKKNCNILREKEWTEIRRHTFAYLFQDLRLFPELPAYENIELKNQLTRYKTEIEIRNYFDILGIGDKWNTKIGKMSFGQQQRVAFIRSICQPFDFILLDEPISHLDEENGKLMSRILLQEAAQQEAAIIVTSIGKHLDINYDKILSL